MSRIDRITRAASGPEAVLRAQRLLAIARVSPRPDRDPADERDEHEPEGAPRRPPGGDEPGHVDVRA